MFTHFSEKQNTIAGLHRFMQVKEQSFGIGLFCYFLVTGYSRILFFFTFIIKMIILILIPVNCTEKCHWYNSKGLKNVSYEYYHLSIMNEEMEI